VEKKNTPQNKATTPANSGAGAPPPMFGNLISSKPKRAGAGGIASTATSIVVHAAIIVGLVYATAHAAAAPEKEDAPTLIQLAPEEAPPPPPPPPPKLDVPPPTAADAPVAKGFQTLAVPDVVPPDIPPPQVGVQIREEDFSAKGVAGGKADGKEGGRVTNDLAAAPFVTPMDVSPKLLNREEIQAAIQRNYPAMMRDAGIGGKTKVWFFIDETGKVVKSQVNTSSGYDQLDAAALKVAPLAKFTPAMTHDKKIPVWVAMDIVFQVH
jgi:protein TonB